MPLDPRRLMFESKRAEPARPHPPDLRRGDELGLRRLDEEAAWIERYRQLWDARFDELDKVVEELERKEKVDGRKNSE